MSRDKTIHIVYALDDNYAEMTCVSMASMLANTKKQVRFHVLESDLSADNKEILSGLGKRFKHGNWEFHHMNLTEDEGFFLGLDSYVTRETYYRLYLGNIFPYLDKVIYIDGDTVIEGDISELWNISLDDKIVAMVADVVTNAFDISKRLLGIEDRDIYFNAGVAVFDLNKIRAVDLLAQVEEKAEKLYRLFMDEKAPWFHDQDMLNHILYRRIKPLPPKFNFQVHSGLYTVPCCDNPYCYRLKNWMEAYKYPIIIHFVNKPKPSKITRTYILGIYWERYYAYKAMTPYADVESDKRKIKKYYRLLNCMDKTILVADAFFKIKWHALFVNLANNLKHPPKNKKLALWGAGNHIRCMMIVFAANDVYADAIVDGLPENQNSKVFHYTVQSPEILKGRNEEYFVLLTMEQLKPALLVSKILEDYGYNADEYAHAYAPLWKVLNEEL
ncbi:MAG: glycosyltransferase family 8 protein [Clostridiales Family XIII bacterium]|jgi:lipopolysaccharide biosynthesis glycosyltransferase|nr:glycosyltransferase family 8 protein [Clostridiales Family XIII bacterium]